jgi:hypothetical protein
LESNAFVLTRRTPWEVLFKILEKHTCNNEKYPQKWVELQHIPHISQAEEIPLVELLAILRRKLLRGNQREGKTERRKKFQQFTQEYHKEFPKNNAVRLYFAKMRMVNSTPHWRYFKKSNNSHWKLMALQTKRFLDNGEITIFRKNQLARRSAKVDFHVESLEKFLPKTHSRFFFVEIGVPNTRIFLYHLVKIFKKFPKDVQVIDSALCALNILLGEGLHNVFYSLSADVCLLLTLELCREGILYLR